VQRASLDNYPGAILQARLIGLSWRMDGKWFSAVRAERELLSSKLWIMSRSLSKRSHSEIGRFMEIIDRSVLRQILIRWQAGEIDEREVHEEAEAILDRYTGERDLPESDERSIGLEVASQLEILNHQLITKDDIPVMLRFLDTERGREIEAWDEWRRYWDSIDYETRRRQLRHNTYYST